MYIYVFRYFGFLVIIDILSRCFFSGASKKLIDWMFHAQHMGIGIKTEE